MMQYAGLDVSLKQVAFCLLDDAGATVARVAVPTDPDAIVGLFAEKKIASGRIEHESDLLSIWLHRELEKRGLPIVCVDARIAHRALPASATCSYRAGGNRPVGRSACSGSSKTAGFACEWPGAPVRRAAVESCRSMLASQVGHLRAGSPDLRN
ncbi:hypothetical protein LNKW23_47930 [Paralimibaculum aggregatum]|uniref:Transposase n=1 Tax=Paralimibaculum aggregatum TaxID=3036245 RepID=A0ABQ6LU09_9RHOB|nr:hypothetical protein [Limibaculum sp. NKW23]GMG85570.1 hypothetical protein LNKW23_47930 [Limibaculum sp. NKW23]